MKKRHIGFKTKNPATLINNLREIKVKVLLELAEKESKKLKRF